MKCFGSTSTTRNDTDASLVSQIDGYDATGAVTTRRKRNNTTKDEGAEREAGDIESLPDS